jgi:hypothetical protein
MPPHAGSNGYGHTPYGALGGAAAPAPAATASIKLKNFSTPSAFLKPSHVVAVHCCLHPSLHAGANCYGHTPYGAPGGAAAPAPAATTSIKLKDCPTPELLQHLPRMQRLMGRLLMCVPEGAAVVHPIILVSFSVFVCLFLNACELGL